MSRKRRVYNRIIMHVGTHVLLLNWGCFELCLFRHRVWSSGFSTKFCFGGCEYLVLGSYYMEGLHYIRDEKDLSLPTFSKKKWKSEVTPPYV